MTAYYAISNTTGSRGVYLFTSQADRTRYCLENPMVYPITYEQWRFFTGPVATDRRGQYPIFDCRPKPRRQDENG